MTNPKPAELLTSIKERAAKSKKGHGVVAVLSYKQVIIDAREAGCSKHVIWKELNDKGLMPIAYRTFLDHFYNHIEQKSPTAKITKKVVTPKKESGKVDGNSQDANLDKYTYKHDPVADMSLLESKNKPKEN